MRKETNGIELDSTNLFESNVDSIWLDYLSVRHKRLEEEGSLECGSGVFELKRPLKPSELNFVRAGTWICP